MLNKNRDLLGYGFVAKVPSLILRARSVRYFWLSMLKLLLLEPISRSILCFLTVGLSQITITATANAFPFAWN